MYLLDNLDVSGITQVVIQKKHSTEKPRVYNRLDNKDWHDSKRDEIVLDMYMGDIIRQFLGKDRYIYLPSGKQLIVPAYRLWIHNETINIEKLYYGDYVLNG